jgi:hypothetical protein
LAQLRNLASESLEIMDDITNFTIAKIATLSDVTEAFVEKIKKTLK